MSLCFLMNREIGMIWGRGRYGRERDRREREGVREGEREKRIICDS